MRRWRIPAVYGILLAMCIMMPGCDSTGNGDAAKPETGEEGEDSPAEESGPKDAYEDYIRNAIASVDKGSQQNAADAPVEQVEQPFEGSVDIRVLRNRNL